MHVPAIEIILTNYCNQNCSFCFAKKEVGSFLKTEMTFPSFRFLVKKLKKSGIINIYISGGEPTLHPQFISIIKYALKHFFSIYVFTNGTFSSKVKEYLISVGPRISYMFNICTPGFLLNKRIRNLVSNNIAGLSKNSDVVVAINGFFQDGITERKALDFIDNNLLKRVGVCICPTRSIAGMKNSISINDFPKMGKNICSLIRYLERRGPPNLIDFPSGITPCMFSPKEHLFLKKRGIKLRINCHLGAEDRWFSITPNLTAFECFPLSTQERFKIRQNTDLLQIKYKFQSLQRKYNKKFTLKKCLKCPFYDFGIKKCPGPCLAFRINALKQQLIKNRQKA